MNETEVRLLEQLAAKLGTTASYLWSVLIKQAQIEIAVDIGWAVLVFVMFFAVRAFWKWSRASDDDDLWMPISFIAFAVWALTAVMVAICCITEIPTLLLNPDYWALKQILATVKK